LSGNALTFLMAGTSRDSETLASIRTLLLAALAVGVLGTIGELILLRHIDKPTQWIPIVLLVVALPIVGWHARAPRPRGVRALQVLMAGFIVAGVLGVGLHYDGNVDFERELQPDEHGWTFLRKTVAGATPVLAPGSMVLLGLVGLAHAYRHPALTGLNSPQEIQQ
jgi:hypothetical protein